MKPIDKLYTTALSIATASAFSFFIFAYKIIAEHPVLIVISGTVISLLVYRGSLSVLTYITKEVEWIKKKLLGPEYLNGTWAGFYIGRLGHERFFVERYEQEVDDLVIRGESKDEHWQPHGYWNSLSSLISVKNGSIAYMYEVRPIKDKMNGEGIAFFIFERESPKKCAKALSGYTIDAHIGARMKSKMIKLSDHTDYDKDQAFTKARELFTASLAEQI